jgi:hypothetical protein
VNLIVPFTAGQVADRFMPAQYALALFHLLGGVLLFGLAFQREFVPMTALMLAYAFFYAPTLALSNSVAFRNLKDPEVEFGPIRVWGTIGWIAASRAGEPSCARTGPARCSGASSMCFALSGGISVLAAVYSEPDPAPHPAREGVVQTRWRFTKAFGLLRDPNYRVFFIIALIVGNGAATLLRADLPVPAGGRRRGRHHSETN